MSVWIHKVESYFLLFGKYIQGFTSIKSAKPISVSKNNINIIINDIYKQTRQPKNLKKTSNSFNFLHCWNSSDCLNELLIVEQRWSQQICTAIPLISGHSVLFHANRSGIYLIFHQVNFLCVIRATKIYGNNLGNQLCLWPWPSSETFWLSLSFHKISWRLHMKVEMFN